MTNPKAAGVAFGEEGRVRLRQGIAIVGAQIV
jgi:hypothetical protein